MSSAVLPSSKVALLIEDNSSRQSQNEAIIGHPFFILLVAIRTTSTQRELAEDGPEMNRLRDAYLEPWTKFATRKTLLAMFAIANRLSMANRALS